MTIMRPDYFLTIIFPLLFILLCGCQPTSDGMGADEYTTHIAEWDSERLERLKAPEGWVNLAGLFWLNEGENTIGSAAGNDIVFPRGPEVAGTVTLNDKQVIFDPFRGAEIKSEGEALAEPVTIFDKEGKSTLLTVDSLGFFIIKRGELFGIRLRDYLSYRLDELKQIERYPARQEWIIKARFIESEEEVTVRVPDVLGETNEEKVPGILEFDHNGEVHRLYPTGSRERLFIIFADETNALETYGAGRFLSAEGPDSDDYVYIDFNKAYNPPCAFTPYATCPLPPKENYLSFDVLAGEKAVSH